MKKMWKKEKEQKSTPAPEVDVATLEVVEKIHNEFATASEKLYNEAISLIQKMGVPNEDKIERLKKLGFIQSNEVTGSEKVIAKKKEAETLKNVITYFHDRYPLYKFITEDSILKICKKYDLIYGEAAKYIGFVPEKNLKEMESFEVDPEDMLYHNTTQWRDSTYTYAQGIDNTKRALIMSTGKQPSDTAVIKHFNETYAPETKFNIVAPKEDFNISSREEIKNHKIVAKPIPDPVVLFPVNKGYLIITAWGPEASDPLVVNEKSN